MSIDENRNITNNNSTTVAEKQLLVSQATLRHDRWQLWLTVIGSAIAGAFAMAVFIFYQKDLIVLQQKLVATQIFRDKFATVSEMQKNDLNAINLKFAEILNKLDEQEKTRRITLADYEILSHLTPKVDYKEKDSGTVSYSKSRIKMTQFVSNNGHYPLIYNTELEYIDFEFTGGKMVRLLEGSDFNYSRESKINTDKNTKLIPKINNRSIGPIGDAGEEISLSMVIEITDKGKERLLKIFRQRKAIKLITSLIISYTIKPSLASILIKPVEDVFGRDVIIDTISGKKSIIYTSSVLNGNMNALLGPIY